MQEAQPLPDAEAHWVPSPRNGQGWQPPTTLASRSLTDSPVPPPAGVAAPLTGTTRRSIIPAEALGPDIPIKHFTLALVASSRLGITSSIFPRWTEPPGQARGQTLPHPPIPGAGLLTTGTRFNQEELRHSWGEKPSAFPGTSIHLRRGEKQPWSPPRGAPCSCLCPSHWSGCLLPARTLGSQENGKRGPRETQAGPDGTHLEESEASGGGALPEGQLQPLQEAASGLRGEEGPALEASSTVCFLGKSQTESCPGEHPF